jgi:tetratricopeptide (TPR) repeat protein
LKIRAVLVAVAVILSVHLKAQISDTSVSPPRFPQLLSEAKECSSRGDWEKAEGLWQRVVAENPLNGAYWYELAAVRVRRREYVSAIAAYKRVTELGQGPGFYGYRYTPLMDIARCYARLGNRKKAMTWIDQALADGFRPLEDLQHDEAFVNLREMPHFRAQAGLP